MTHLKALETKKDPSDRKAWKMRLIRRMYGRGFDKKVILDLFQFIDWLMALPEELEEEFEEERRSRRRRRCRM